LYGFCPVRIFKSPNAVYDSGCRELHEFGSTPEWTLLRLRSYCFRCCCYRLRLFRRISILLDIWQMILNLKFLKEFILVAYKVYDIGTVRLFTTRIQRSHTILILIFNKKKNLKKITDSFISENVLAIDEIAITASENTNVLDICKSPQTI